MDLKVFNTMGTVYMCPVCFKTYDINLHDTIKKERVRCKVPEKYDRFFRHCGAFVRISACIYAPCCSKPAVDDWVELFPIDPDMIEIIREFNRLGYKTVSCCQGHYDIEHNWFSLPYIVFARNRIKTLSNIIEKISYDYFSNRDSIKRKYRVIESTLGLELTQLSYDHGDARYILHTLHRDGTTGSYEHYVKVSDFGTDDTAYALAETKRRQSLDMLTRLLLVLEKN